MSNLPNSNKIFYLMIIFALVNLSLSESALGVTCVEIFESLAPKKTSHLTLVVDHTEPKPYPKLADTYLDPSQASELFDALAAAEFVPLSSSFRKTIKVLDPLLSQFPEYRNVSVQFTFGNYQRGVNTDFDSLPIGHFATLPKDVFLIVTLTNADHLTMASASELKIIKKLGINPSTIMETMVGNIAFIEKFLPSERIHSLMQETSIRIPNSEIMNTNRVGKWEVEDFAEYGAPGPDTKLFVDLEGMSRQEVYTFANLFATYLEGRSTRSYQQ